MKNNLSTSSSTNNVINKDTNNMNDNSNNNVDTFNSTCSNSMEDYRWLLNFK